MVLSAAQKGLDAQAHLPKYFTFQEFICLDPEPNPIVFRLSRSDMASGKFPLYMPYSYFHVLEPKTPRGTLLSFCEQVLPPSALRTDQKERCP